MAFRLRYLCYICDLEGIPRQMRILAGNEQCVNIANRRRQELGLNELNIDQNTRICFNCSNSVY